MAKPRKRQDTPAVGVPVQSNTPKIVGGIAVLVALLLVIAVVATKPWQEDESGKSDDGTELLQFQAVSVTGEPLAKEPEQGQPDPAIGAVAPTLAGKSFDGTPVEVKPGERPKAVLFFAHWCPHCQKELPVVKKWLDANQSKYDVEFVAVATGTNPSSANFPPSDWFKKEKWPLTVMADSSNATAANAYGLASYPYMVFLDKDNKLVARVSAEVSEAEFTTYVERIAQPKS